MVIICKCFFHVLNDFVLMFFSSNTLSGSFLFTKANPLTVRAKVVISPSINNGFYLGAVRVINFIFITNNIIVIIIITIRPSMYIENAKKVCHRKSALQNTGVHREFLNLGSYIHTAAKTNINHQIVSKYNAACTELEISAGWLMR